MSSFKEAVQKDVAAVFNNTNEFAEDKVIYYDGAEYTVPVVISDYRPEEWKQDKSEYSQAVYTIRQTIYIPAEALGFTPEITHKIEVDGVEWDITAASEEMGELVLSLGRYDE